jgi:hypothetical protein
VIDRGPGEEEDLLVANPNHRRDSDESEDEDADEPDEDARPQEPEDDVEKLSRNIHTLAVVPD